jgi:hypothetical protein
MVLALILVAMDMRVDLDELRSSGKTDDAGTLAIGWSELKVPHEFSAAETAGESRSGRVRMIGYMMDGYRPSRDGEQVEMFILLPEAGEFLHPAHRVPDKMVEVRPVHPIAFRYRQLVWASGTLNRTLARRGDDRAAWAMSDAEVSPASDRDIGKWFHP